MTDGWCEVNGLRAVRHRGFVMIEGYEVATVDHSFIDAPSIPTPRTRGRRRRWASVTAGGDPIGLYVTTVMYRTKRAAREHDPRGVVFGQVGDLWVPEP